MFNRVDKKILGLAILAFSSADLMAGNIILEGNYQGKNLYVQNPFAGSCVGFCTIKVEVNGQVIFFFKQKTAYEI